MFISVSSNLIVAGEETSDPTTGAGFMWPVVGDTRITAVSMSQARQETKQLYVAGYLNSIAIP